MLEKQIKLGAHFHVSMGLAKTETLGAVTLDTSTMVNDPSAKGNCVYPDSPKVNFPWRLSMDMANSTKKALAPTTSV